MKFNHECARDLLLTIEETFRPIDAKTTDYLHKLPQLEKYTYDDVSYSAIQLRDSGLIKTNPNPINRGLDIILTVRDITPEGRAFLESIRKDTAWKKIKGIASKVGNITVESLIRAAANSLF
ncbi:DUF2513 domain-containing protein [Paenibacillus sp. J5C_2022]|uniref:DUF2513 domain-containing protein n=1 Tax=Paenibacillus sp. J5C2022 TaxID=2977129 RepID=UPI0021CECDF9|nr:DUF2513 domain-containing protein [Paenibacillus sp. J5C2022]MCU6709369.1 DUF2513 domain-containing protein [Paenibacillus sp. J5C2022]